MKLYILPFIFLFSLSIQAQNMTDVISHNFKVFDREDQDYNSGTICKDDSLYIRHLFNLIHKYKDDKKMFENINEGLNRILKIDNTPFTFAHELMKIYVREFKACKNYHVNILNLSKEPKIYYIISLGQGSTSKKPLFDELYLDCMLNQQLKLEMLESDFFLGEWKQVDAKVLKRFFESCDRSMSLRKMRCKTKSKAIRNGISEMELYIKQNNLK